MYYAENGEWYVDEGHFELSRLVDSIHSKLTLSTNYFPTKCDIEMIKIKEKSSKPGFMWGLFHE